MIRFYAPFSYLIYSRLHSALEKISWVLIYVVPMIFFSYSVSKLDSPSEFLLLVTLAISAFIALYEIGYLENDVKAIEKESEPTMRIQQKDRSFFRDNYKKLVGARYIFVVFSLFVFLSIEYFYTSELYVLQYLLILIMARFSFLAHNHFRGRSNIFTFALLQISKYLSIPMLFLPMKDSLFLIFSLLLIFPVVRTMEYASSGKFEFIKYKKFIGNHDKFRIKYYLMLVVVSIILLYTYDDTEMILLIIAATCFLFFRIAVYALVASQIYKRES